MPPDKLTPRWPDEAAVLRWLEAREPQIRAGVAGTPPVLAVILPMVLVGVAAQSTRSTLPALGALLAMPVLVALAMLFSGAVLAEPLARKALRTANGELGLVAAAVVLTPVLPLTAIGLDAMLLVLLRTAEPHMIAANALIRAYTWAMVWTWPLTPLARREIPRQHWLAVLPVIAVCTLSRPPGLFTALTLLAIPAAWLGASALRPNLLSGVTMASPTAPNTAELKCSFCGKDRLNVKKLVAGPNVAICDECIGLSNDILVEEAAKDRAAAAPVVPTQADRQALRTALADAAPGLAPATDALATALFVQRLRASGAAVKPGRVLIVGPTGSGKSTLLAAALAAVPLPHAHTEATRLTETGYVGECVENLLAELVDAAGGTPEAATHGILAIDGLHHLSRRGPSFTGRDISGGEVQRELLRLLDGRAAPLAYNRPRHPQPQAPHFPADRVLVLASATVPADAPTDDEALRAFLIGEGYSPELLARFERIVRLPALDPQRALIRLRHAAGPLAPLRALAAALKVDLTVSDATIDALAARASDATGGWAIARAVDALHERVLSAEGAARL